MESVKVVLVLQLVSLAWCKHVLVLGGNGFMGTYAVEELLAAGHTVSLLNRGNWYWDSHARVADRISHHLKCDRNNPLADCPALQEMLDKSPVDVAVDFSAYDRHAVEQACSVLQGRVSLYIYISTDSVYEVCVEREGPSREEDAVRPADEEERERLNSRDPYGHRKLEGEEALQEQVSGAGGIAFVSLRLPDVVGPRDGTYRWPFYQTWVRLSGLLDEDLRLRVAANLIDKPMSVVYAPDVGRVVARLVSHPPPSEILNTAVNLAYRDPTTVSEMLRGIASVLNVSVDVRSSNEPGTPAFFPSVTRGPVDSSRAYNLLQWQPTAWSTALEETVSFYEDVLTADRFAGERTYILSSLARLIGAQAETLVEAHRKLFGSGMGVHEEF